MKLILGLLILFTAQTFANEILDCFAPALEGLNADREDLQEWSQDVRETSLRLQQQRQRCNELPRDDPPTAIQDRVIQACNAAWSATFAYESNRLLTDLVAIDPELAAELREHAGSCIIGARKYFGKILKNVF